MGSPSDELGHRADELPHRVCISRAFYLGMHEVTVSQFRRFVELTGYRPYERECSSTDRSAEPYFLAPAPRGTHSSWRDAGFHQGDDHPVVNVSWLDAVEFCRWLSRTEGRPYRLPTEAEWEYACRAGSTQAHTLATARAECPFAENLATSGRINAATIPSWDDAYEYTAPVGSFPPNPWGLRDMYGNVAEYCLDWYGADYYRRSPRKDPQGPESGHFRVLRGGSWCQSKACSRSGGRSTCRETLGYPFVGFRVAAECR